MDIQNNPQRYCENCMCENCIYQKYALAERQFKSKIDALCYKFIMLLKIKSNIY